MTAPLLQARDLAKRFGPVHALDDVSFSIEAGAVECLLGDNGAGKSTAIKILSGVYPPDRGSLRFEGNEVRFRSPRDALDRGIATVFQDLAMIPLLPVVRCFFLGREPVKSRMPSRKRKAGPLAHFDIQAAADLALTELHRIGITLNDPYQPIGTLSGGERQAVAIARAVYFGARVLVLDEPTSALGVREAAIVLRYVLQARSRGLGVLLITHNVEHAFAVGDRFTILDHGKSIGTFKRSDVTVGELQSLMAGSQGLQELSAELDALVTDAHGSRGTSRLEDGSGEHGG